MKLNAQTDFSLRLLMYLAAKEGGTATIQEVSSRLGLSQSHMMRVAAKLTAKGFVASTRGRLGGISLAKEPIDITVEDVLLAMEPDFALVACFGSAKDSCTIEPGCLLKAALSSAMEAFFSELRSVSLQQLTQPNRIHLSKIFRLDAVSESTRPGGMNLRSTIGRSS